MNQILKVVPVLLAGVLLAACAGTGKKPGDGAAVEDRGGAGAAGIGAGGAFSGSPWDDPSSPLSKRVVYFDFDRADVRPEDRETIAAHAQYLAANPQLAIKLEGHADERGTREYNIALGERRAQAVRSLMQVQGVAPNQMTTISFGEEKPVVDGHDDYAWSQNRRVEIVYPAAQ